ncbi:MAG: hypothetical protein Q9226_000991 [Calogaya cf. arnoldii]
MPPVIPSSLPIIHGSQRRSRPLSMRHVQGRAARQLFKRARVGATAQIEGPGKTPAITEGETTQHPEQPRYTVDTANLHPRVEQRARASAATMTNATGCRRLKDWSGAKIAEKEAQAVLDRVQDAEKEAKVDSDRARQLLESAKAETAHARDMVQRELARQRGHRDGSAEESDKSDDTDSSE